MNNKISNAKVEVPTTTEMNDKDYLNSMLEIEKSIVKNYAVCLTEASNEGLYSNYHDMFDNACDIQREIYNMMFKKGWYSVDQAELAKINQKMSMMSQELPQLENNN